MIHKISIVIPILNEASIICKLIEYLLKNSSEKNIVEIIIVDGGSEDSSVKVVNTFISKYNSNVSAFSTKLKLIHSEKGRAKQMNAGAKKITGNILYFLHADSYPPKNFDKYIVNEVSKGNKAGGFRMKFDSNTFILKASQWFTRFNFKFFRGGDQSIFITKELFMSLNGYDESYIIYEDYNLISKIYDQFNYTIIKDYVITSARRYRKNGACKLQYHFAIIHLKKIMGSTATELHQYYKNNIR